MVIGVGMMSRLGVGFIMGEVQGFATLKATGLAMNGGTIMKASATNTITVMRRQYMPAGL